MVHVVNLATCRDNLHRLGIDKDVHDTVDQHRDELVTLRKQETASVSFLLTQLRHKLIELADIHTFLRKAVKLVQSMFESFLADGFQQVVNTIHLEGLQCILIISRGENNRASDIDLFKNGKRRAVGQMNVHKHQVRHGMAGNPIDTVFNGFKYANDFNTWADFQKKLLQRLRSHYFVFNYQCFHSDCTFSLRGKVTLKIFPSSKISTFSFHFIRYRSERLANPIPVPSSFPIFG